MKKFLCITGVAAIVTAMVLNVNISSREESMSNITLANVKALARGENEASGDYWCCSPYDVKCAVGDKVTIWGKLKKEKCQ